MKKSAGFSVIWVIIVILISVIPLAKAVTGWQSSISRAAEDKYLIDGTRFGFEKIKDSDSWNQYSNKEYEYSLKYPDTWSLKTNYETEDNNILSRERVISDKIDVTVTVYKHFDNKPKKGTVKAGGNEFRIIENTIKRKSVFIESKNMTYVIDFAQVNYFQTEDQFTEIFKLFLRNFKLVD